MLTSLRTLIADDEPLARAYLRRQLEAQGVTIIGESGNATEALAECDALRPNVLFLDVQMPGPDGIAAATTLRMLPAPPLLVFVTGYSKYAATAFEYDAVDYLLKPVSAERLLTTLTRLRRRLAPPMAADQVTGDIANASSTIREELTYPRHLPIRSDYAVLLMKREELVFAEARDKKVYLYDKGANGQYTEHRAFHTLTQLADILPPDQFCRIHDSYLVNLGEICELSFLGNHSYSVHLQSGRDLPVGRTHYIELRRRLGLP